MIYPTVKKWYRNQILNAKILVGLSAFLCILFLTIEIFVNRGLWYFCLVFFPLAIYGVLFLFSSKDKYGRKICIGDNSLELMNWKGMTLRKTPYSDITNIGIISGYITGMKGFQKTEVFICLCLNNAILLDEFEYRDIYNNENYYILMYDENLENVIKVKTGLIN